MRAQNRLCAVKQVIRAQNDLCVMRRGYARSLRFMRGGTRLCALRTVYAR